MSDGKHHFLFQKKHSFWVGWISDTGQAEMRSSQVPKNSIIQRGILDKKKGSERTPHLMGSFLKLGGHPTSFGQKF